MEDLSGLAGTIFKLLADKLSTLDLVLLIMLATLLFVCWRVLRMVWDVQQEQHQEITDRILQLEVRHFEDTKLITEHIERQNQLQRDNADRFNKMTVELVRTVTMLEERRNKQ